MNNKEKLNPKELIVNYICNESLKLTYLKLLNSKKYNKLNKSVSDKDLLKTFTSISIELISSLKQDLRGK